MGGVKRILTLLTLSLLGCCISANFVSVTYDGSKYDIHDGPVENWVARANFTDTTFENGYAALEVETNAEFNDSIQAYAAGIAEGATTYEMIYNAYRNTVEGYCEKTSQENCDRIFSFLDENTQWLDTHSAEMGGSCPVMHNSRLILAQMEGVADGYNRTADKPIEDNTILMLNLMGDIEDLEEALDPAYRNMTAKDWVEAGHTKRDGRCSALIKVLPDNADLYVSQDSWNTYSAMLRINKKYILPFRRTGDSPPEDINPGHTVSFASYPGMLYSGDDFHIISTGLLSMETTIGNSNPELWQHVQPNEQILEWMRTIIANRVGVDGESWCNYFSKHNSGTYNNQWMVVDYKLFEPGHPIVPNTLWVLEQIPGFIQSGDQSALLLLKSFWPSYNAAFYEDVFNMSGMPELVEKYGDWFTYDKTPRALIFERDHDSVKDMDSMLKLMRSNDYKNDPLGQCECDPPYSGENAISARSDLNPANGTYPFSALSHRLHGGTDCKITNFHMAKEYRFLAMNGPTYDQQPAFKWSTLTEEEQGQYPHYGHPDEFKFPAVDHEWQW